MAKRNKKRISDGNIQSSMAPSGPVSISVRLSAKLASSCKAYSDAFGVSQNALICVALADYLQRKGLCLINEINER